MTTIEKPVCHNIWGGRQMVEAMKQSDQIVAAGTQNRSDNGLQEAMELIHAIGRREKPLNPPVSLSYDPSSSAMEQAPMHDDEAQKLVKYPFGQAASWVGVIFAAVMTFVLGLDVFTTTAAPKTNDD